MRRAMPERVASPPYDQDAEEDPDDEPGVLAAALAALALGCLALVWIWLVVLER